jgi:hypothetical protein
MRRNGRRRGGQPERTRPKFDEAGLALVYQGEKASGEDSTFFKLVSR